MRAPTSRIALALTLFALLALTLAACGGDDDGGGSQGSATTSTKEDGVATGPTDDFEPAPLQISGEGDELQEAAEAVHAFYVTRARGEWSATCEQVAQVMLEKLESLAKQSERKDCADMLESFTTVMSDEEWREVTVMDAESLNASGEQATLVYRGAGDEIYSIPLREEDGEWRMEALQGTTSG